MKLLELTPASDGIHKYKAVFEQDNGRKKTTQFGAKGMMDFIQYSKQSPSKANIHKESYLTRHRVTENWNDPLTAGALSRWILWNKPTLSASLQDFRQRFSL